MDLHFQPLPHPERHESELVTIRGGSELKRHTHPVDVMLRTMRGTCIVMLRGERHRLHPGEHLFIPANVPHTVTSGLGGCAFLLTRQASPAHVGPAHW